MISSQKTFFIQSGRNRDAADIISSIGSSVIIGRTNSGTYCCVSAITGSECRYFYRKDYSKKSDKQEKKRTMFFIAIFNNTAENTLTFEKK